LAHQSQLNHQDAAGSLALSDGAVVFHAAAAGAKSDSDNEGVGSGPDVPGAPLLDMKL